MLICHVEINRIIFQSYANDLWRKIYPEKAHNFGMSFYPKFKMIFFFLPKMYWIKKFVGPDINWEKVERHRQHIIKSDFPATKTACFEIFQWCLFVKG